jgi:hypothetical protein
MRPTVSSRAKRKSFDAAAAASAKCVLKDRPPPDFRTHSDTRSNRPRRRVVRKVKKKGGVKDAESKPDVPADLQDPV